MSDSEFRRWCNTSLDRCTSNTHTPTHTHIHTHLHIPTYTNTHTHKHKHPNTQCLRRLPDESCADESVVVSLWQHEMISIIAGSLLRHSDTLWLHETITNIRKQVPPFYDRCE